VPPKKHLRNPYIAGVTCKITLNEPDSSDIKFIEKWEAIMTEVVFGLVYIMSVAGLTAWICRRRPVSPWAKAKPTRNLKWHWLIRPDGTVDWAVAHGLADLRRPDSKW
jgi:hypothetical protein